VEERKGIRAFDIVVVDTVKRGTVYVDPKMIDDLDIRKKEQGQFLLDSTTRSPKKKLVEDSTVDSEHSILLYRHKQPRNYKGNNGERDEAAFWAATGEYMSENMPQAIWLPLLRKGGDAADLKLYREFAVSFIDGGRFEAKNTRGVKVDQSLHQKHANNNNMGFLGFTCTDGRGMVQHINHLLNEELMPEGANHWPFVGPGEDNKVSQTS
jgi:hypothetical protein